jgi:ATP-dependent exoDNAse (exonuclease V) alpha subunit
LDNDLLVGIKENPITLITGEAGTGKSTLIAELRSKLHGNVVVVAFTGVAALNVSGETIHSFFGFPITILSDDKKGDHNFEEKFKRVDHLIVDEVSMLRADVLDGIFRTFETYGKSPTEPLGGVKLILVGDFLQLEPVLDQDEDARRYFYRRYQTSFFFEASGFDRYRTYIRVLTQNYRQSGDASFLNLLSRIRTGEPNETDLLALHAQVSHFDGASVLLSTTNERVDFVNDRALSELKTKERVFDAYVTGSFPDQSYPATTELRLKEKAVVMFVRNDSSKSRRWVNGTLAKVTAFHKDSIEVSLLESGSYYDVQRSTWENYAYVYDRDRNALAVNVSGAFEQFPLALAWARTIHKSQGQTLDRIHIDLPTEFTVMPSQLYVALSRARRLESISLSRKITKEDCSVNRRASEAWRFAQKNNNQATFFKLSDLGVGVSQAPQPTRQPSGVGLTLIALVDRVIQTGGRLNMDYVSGTGRKWRVVRPLEWELAEVKFVAYCEDNKENRTFRVDRIQDANII